MPRYKIAGVVFDAQTKYEYNDSLSKDYLYNGDEEPVMCIKVTEQDILREKAEAPTFPDYYLESLALFRKLCEYVLSNCNGIIFHSSALAVDNQAYLFTAPSGTGKSTHASLWRELLGDKVVMINDDKPIIRYEDGDFYVYGTPWNGKHRLGENIRVKLKAICELKRGTENSIKKISPMEMFVTIMNQTMRPKKEEDMDKLLSLIEILLSKVELFRLHCNISLEAAKLSYNTMKGE